MKRRTDRAGVAIIVCALLCGSIHTSAAASRKERYLGIRIAEMEAKVALSHIVDEMDLDQKQMEVLMECRQRFAPLADECYKALYTFAETQEPWDEYARINAKGIWPKGDVLRQVAGLKGNLSSKKKAICTQMNKVADNFTAELSPEQRKRLSELAKGSFVGKSQILAYWAPDDLETSELTEAQRYGLRTAQVKSKLSTHESHLVTAPFLEDVMEKRIKGGKAAMGYAPQTDRDESARFPAYWDYDMWRQYNERTSQIARFTLITGLNPQPEQSMEIVKILDKKLEDTGKAVTALDTDYSGREGRAYCRELEKACNRALKGRKLSDGALQELGRAANTFWRLREKGSQRRAKANKKIVDEVQEILTAGQEKFFVQMHICTLPNQTILNKSRAGQVASDNTAKAVARLDQIKRAKNWDGDNNEKVRLQWLKRFTPGYGKYNERQKGEAYGKMLGVVSRARDMNDGEYLAKREALGEELLWLNDFLTGDLMRERNSTTKFDQILRGRINYYFANPLMHKVLDDRLEAMDRGIAQSE